MIAAQKSFDRVMPSGAIVAHRLDGKYDFSRQHAQLGHLRSVRILASLPLTDEQSARLRALLNSTDSFGGKAMRCFMPGVGFTVGNGAEAVEVLVCLQCYWVYFFNVETKMMEALSQVGHRQLSEFYVELFPGSDPKAA